MARRPGRRFAYLLVVLALLTGACQSGAATTSTDLTTTSTRPGTSTSAPPATVTPSTTLPESTTLPPSVEVPPGMEVGVPEGDGEFPAVVLVHGGGWLVGTPASIEPLAIYLTENGYLTVNAAYKLSLQSPGFPGAINDIACAVRLAASHPRSDGTVTIIGHSAGAHIAAVVAQNGDDYTEDCGYPGTGLPNRFIGLAGPYDISRLGPIMVAFFGQAPEDLPEAWEAGNPQLHVADNPELQSLIIHGDLDQVVPVEFSQLFYEALVASEADVELLVLEGVEHAGVRDPSIVGQTLLDWLEP